MGTKRRAPQLGEIYELALGDGRYAYLQYINRHRESPGYGAFIRVFDVVAPRPVADLTTLPTGDRFCTFFPVGPAANHDIIRLAGKLPVPESYAKWPLFKAFNESLSGERTWYLCAIGEKDLRVDRLRVEHLDLPLLQVVTPPLLRDRILSAWTPRSEAR